MNTTASFNLHDLQEQITDAAVDALNVAAAQGDDPALRLCVDDCRRVYFCEISRDKRTSTDLNGFLTREMIYYRVGAVLRTLPILPVTRETFRPACELSFS